MTTKPRIQFCDECEFDSGWHYEEQLDGSIRSWRPLAENLYFASLARGEL